MTTKRFLSAALLGGLLAGSLSLGGCGVLARGGDDLQTVSVDSAGVEGAALSALGVAGVDRDDTAGAGRQRLKVKLRRNILHGEVVVQTKAGPKTVAVQLGAVTAKGPGTLTVKSTDGYTATWTTGDQTRFVERGSKATADQIDVGEQVAVGGVKSDPQTAQLVVVPKQT